MPELEFSDQLHAEKYRGAGEDFREWANRCASALKDSDLHFRMFREILLDQRFLPAGRVQAAMGSPRRVTAYNCAVAPTIEDSFTDGDNSIMEVAKKAAQTMRMGCGYGYDFSTLRPRGALIASLGSRSSGPIAFMEIYDAVCRATMSAGHRRGAQMGVLRIDHPDVEEFIRAKQNSNRLTGFNMSLAVTDEFMRAKIDGRPFRLHWGGRDYGTVDARALWEEIMRSTWDWAEPGVLFIDRINEMNNLWYCEDIAATNPCAEQPLPPDGTCLLGSFNLVKYVDREAQTFDFRLMARDTKIVVRAMDNVIDRTIYPLPEQEAEAKNKRRMGLGITGLANALEALGHSYGSPGFLLMQARIMSDLRDCLYRQSAWLAKEKGAFPAFDREYMEGRFFQMLSEDVKACVEHWGIRNSHLTSIAPTGTISICADNVSSGIEPPYALSYTRRVRGFDGDVTVEVQDYALMKWGVRGKTATECTLDEHLDVLATAQRYVDSSVSKTINVDPATPWGDFKRVYDRAWESGCKGCTTFNPGGKRVGILAAVADQGGACYVDPETGVKSCD